MDRRQRARLAAIGIGALVCLGAIATAPVRASVETADIMLVDSVDDAAGGGVRTELTDADASIGFVTFLQPDHQRVWVTAGNASSSWNLRFEAPPGETLGVGHYAVNSKVAYSPVMMVWGPSGCGSQIVGSFTIEQLDWDVNGNPAALAVTFEQWCDNSIGPLVGRLRVNTTTGQALLSSPRTDRWFGPVTFGESADPRTYTVESLGDLPVAISSVHVTGGAASDFEKSADGCTGADLNPGDACSFDFDFTPGATGDRVASLAIENDTAEGTRAMPLTGYGRTPTTTSGLGVEPDSTYFQPGIRLLATVQPAPEDNGVEFWLDDELACTGGFASPGTAQCFVAREVGSHELHARYVGSFFHGDSDSTSFEFNVSPVTSLLLRASDTSTAEGVPITFTASVSTASGLLYPGGNVVIRDATTETVLATLAIDFGSGMRATVAAFEPGSHQIEATYEGVDGILDGSTDQVSVIVAADATKPTTTTPRSAPINRGTQTASGQLPMRVSWTGKDDLSGVKRYDVEHQTDGGAWSSPTPVTGASFSTNLAPGHRYRFRVRAIDWAGNVGAWSYGTSFSLRRYADYARAADYIGTWKKAYTEPYWWGGTAMKSSTAGSRVRFTLTGKTFAWLTYFGPNRGKAKIYVNGAYKATVDLYSTTGRATVIGWAKSWETVATRTVEIRVVGTSGRPRVDVDGFWVGS
jgi:hypothetical protein